MLLIDWIPYGSGNSQIISESAGNVANVGDFAVLDIIFDKSICMAYAAQPKRIYQQFSDEISFNRRAITAYEQLLGIIYAYLPFMIFPLYSAIEKIDYTLIEAAYDLGSSPMTAFFSIVVPLAMPGIYAGSALVFVPAIGEFVIPELLGGAQTLTIGRLVWNEFFGNLSWPTAAALSIILLMFVVFPIVLMQRRKEVRLLRDVR